jgi:hypothetical protein
VAERSTESHAKRLGFAATGTEDEVAVGGRIHVRSVIQFGGGKSCREKNDNCGKGWKLVECIQLRLLGKVLERSEKN